MDESDIRRLARREFDGTETRRKAAGAMADVLADVPPTQLTPMGERELLARARRRLERQPNAGPRVGGGGN